MVNRHLFRIATGWAVYTSSGEVLAIGTPDWSRERAEHELDTMSLEGQGWTRCDVRSIAASLTLNVSHNCNLRCRYCYAGDGSYNTGEGLMTEEVARKAIRSYIEDARTPLFELKFFGGEPLLNLSAMAAGLSELGNQRLKIGVVTNGTMFTDEFFELRDRYDMTVTVSLDGPPHVHNALRPGVGGADSYDRVARGIELLLNRVPVHRVRYEATYTRVHQQAGLSRLDVAQHMRGLGLLVGFTYYYIGTDPALRAEPDGQDGEFTAAMLDNMLVDNPYTDYEAVRVISRLVSRRYSDYFCPVGVVNYLVSPSGKVYPCNLFVEPEFVMGTIDEDWRAGDRARMVLDKLDPIINRTGMKECGVCWMYELCGGCPALVYKETGRLVGPVGPLCDQKRQSTEMTLGWLAEVFQSPERWERLQRTLSRLCLLEQ